MLLESEMKIKLLWISILFTVTISIVSAQKFSKFNRPMIDLNPKPQVTTPKLPEERRKMSIFPKSMVKFVVTSKPYSKVREYSPNEETTKSLMHRQVIPKETKNIKTSSTSLPIGKFTTFATSTKRLYTSRTQFTTKPPTETPEDTNYYESEEDSYIQEPSVHHNVVYKSENNLNVFDEKHFADDTGLADKVKEDDTIDLEAVESNGSNKVSMNKYPAQETNENILTTTEIGRLTVLRTRKNKVEHHNESDDKENKTVIPEDAKNGPVYEEPESDEVTNNRKKRLSILKRGGYNNIFIEKLIKKENDVLNEQNDMNEFIFIKDYLTIPVDVKKSPNYEYITADMDDSDEVATEIAWLEEYNYRPERSINIIEEENLGTTVSGFKFTGREPRIESDLVFRNINA